MKAKFYMGPRDGAEIEVQTSNGFAPALYQHAVYHQGGDLIKAQIPIAYYDLDEVKEGIAYYTYRYTV